MRKYFPTNPQSLIITVVLFLILQACSSTQDVTTMTFSTESLEFIAEKGDPQPNGLEVTIETNSDLFFEILVTGVIENVELTTLSTRSATLFVEVPPPLIADQYYGSIIVNGCSEDPCENIIIRKTIEVSYLVTGIYTTGVGSEAAYYNDEFKYDNNGVYKEFNANNPGVLNFTLKSIPEGSTGWSATVSYESSIPGYENIVWLQLDPDTNTVIPANITATVVDYPKNVVNLTEKPNLTATIQIISDAGKITEFVVTLNYLPR